jgi:hypothetical protein
MLAQLAVLVCLAMANDDPLQGYEQALASGQRDVQVVKEFVALFPKARHRITYYTGQAGRPRWSSTVGLFGRYILRVEFNVTFDAGRTKIVKHDPPEFRLQELEKVTYDPKARTEETDWGVDVPFGSKQWRNVVEAKGDLTVLGAKIKRDDPVKGFQEYLDRNFRE